ncbi:MAG: cytochrome c biogenesis protein CcsA [Bdellovibrionales bacterium]|jgi:ABC-type transport system involved in cytochrome c biogenesis permease subunit|nr:cytochrome c biogenesis protein CcsA [Bdellovibrionales bacterium]MBT3525779.1 cytochrome c biogenesis protein CcsA [Bdellovibrionales bacterium]MBT7670238.1 cytochrome c biogenesis protein CcsA [Bdellovibrionales bacterium]MBT7767828.1 cytochrome c biogenesis protein CcsA [Bdellovibrionales bacterium]
MGGTVFLAAGIILDGIWADYSWGRFGGWDPKETWSLIVLLIYMAIIHGKYTSWIPPKRFIPSTANQA